jgi:hypothetical protein
LRQTENGRTARGNPSLSWLDGGISAQTVAALADFTRATLALATLLASIAPHDADPPLAIGLVINKPDILDSSFLD